MSYVNVEVPNLPSEKRAYLKLNNFSGGVCFSKFDSQLSDGQSPFMKNMIFDSNLLRARFGRQILGNGANTEGSLHCVCENTFFGYKIMHIGGGLYSFDGNNFSTLCADVPNCKSFIFEMNAKLYLFCSSAKIFIIDKQLTVEEYEIPTVEIMKNAKYSLTEFEKTENVPDNMLTFRVSVTYAERNAGINYFKLPTECDVAYPIIITDVKTGENPKVGFTVEGDTVTLSEPLYVAYNISYVPAKGSEYRNFDKIFGCTLTCTYGGRTFGGTRVFFSGNADYPGYYFYSELLNPLEVRALSYDILGSGNEKINALAKQKDKLIALCDRSVYEISYSFNNQTGPDFSVAQISGKIGCDIPQSVQLIDNRLVFANSSPGIFIIVSSDYTDELSVLKISANVLGEGTKFGLSNESSLSLQNGISVDFDGKYILLCASGNAYVWDYVNTPFYFSANTLLSQKKLAWYFWDNLRETSLFEINGCLFGTVICKDVVANVSVGADNAVAAGDSVAIVKFSKECSTDFESPINCVFQSGELDFGDGFGKKTLCKLFLNVATKSDVTVKVCVFADGKEIICKSFDFEESEKERINRIFMKIPDYEAYRFSFCVTASGGSAGIYDAALKLRSRGIYYR